jgi:hypothetical protein
MIRTRALLGLAVALACLPVCGAAQTVLVRILDAQSAGPVFGALTYLIDESGQTTLNALSDERGRALFLGLAAGSYRVRVEMIGMATSETELFQIADGTTVSQDIRLEASAIELEGLEVELESGRCEIRGGGEGLLVAEVWDEARKALSAAAFTDQLGTYRYETMTYERHIDRDTKVILSEEQSRREGYMETPFASRPAEDLMTNGFARLGGPENLFYAPDASVLLSDPFLDTHCFRLVEQSDDEEERAELEGLLGLGFQPTGEETGIIDIAGTIWVDRQTAELRWLEYRYQYLPDELSFPEVGGRVDFRRMPDGTWIVPEWWIQMPVLAMRTDLAGRFIQRIERFHQTGGIVLEVREAGGRSLGQRAQTGGVEGLVIDSIGVPLRGVRVGVTGSNQEVYSNAEGRFSITGLTEGRYQIRFVDPGLEAFGFVPAPVMRDVIRGELGYFDFHMPSIGDVLFEACRDEAVPDGSVVLAGMVKDARGRPIPNATVRVRWSLFQVNTPRPTVDNTDIEGTADAAGFYRFCGVPSGRLLTVRALVGENESEPVELRITQDEAARLAVLEVTGPRR